MRAGAAWLALGLLGCRSTPAESDADKTTGDSTDTGDLPDDWWTDGDTGDGEDGDDEEGEDWEDGEDGEDGDEGAYWFGFIEDASADETVGELAWVDEGCEWFVELSVQAADPCPGCGLGFVITIGEAFVEEDSACDEFYDVLTEEGARFTVGFDDELAWVYEEDEDVWEEFAEAFYEGAAVGWFAEL